MGAREERCKSGSPYKNLHVCLIHGIVTPGDEAGLGLDFLGTWVEGDTSFLFFSKPSGDKIEGLMQQRPVLSLMEEHLFAYDEWQGAHPEPIRIGQF